MKTRIKIIEYNDGRKEYICESKETLPLFMLFTIIGTLPYIYYLLTGMWFPLREKNEDRDITGQTITVYRDAIFDNMEEAKKCIDNHIKELEAKKIKEHLQKEKSTVYEYI